MIACGMCWLLSRNWEGVKPDQPKKLTKLGMGGLYTMANGAAMFPARGAEPLANGAGQHEGAPCQEEFAAGRKAEARINGPT
jgi:hypothetical protein